MVHSFSRIDDRTGAVIISVSGDVDVSALPSLVSAVDRAVSESATALVVDLGEVASIDSIGMSLISGLPAQCARVGSRCAVSAPNPEVRGYLESHGVQDIVFSNIGTALASFEERVT